MVHTLGTDAHLVLRIVLQETLDTAAGELLHKHVKLVMVHVCMEKRDRLGGGLH